MGGDEAVEPQIARMKDFRQGEQIAEQAVIGIRSISPTVPYLASH
ncbi:hypothetical protein [Acidiferrobacter thiooxydans]|nr:hypothetical protein [Acidiferrobacter thiooxydans]